MILELQEFANKHKFKRIVIVYEASGLGFGFCDQLHEDGIECHVLSPTPLPDGPKGTQLFAKRAASPFCCPSQRTGHWSHPTVLFSLPLALLHPRVRSHSQWPLDSGSIL